MSSDDPTTKAAERKLRQAKQAETRRLAREERDATKAAERQRKQQDREAERDRRHEQHQTTATAVASALAAEVAVSRGGRPAPARSVHLNASTLWTTGPLATLGGRARMLWLRLATGPESTAIPGLVLATSTGIASSLGWTVEEVERVSASIPASSLRADWRAGVVWLPAILGYQPPHNYKNVLGWRAVFAALPDTPVADDIHADLRIHCAGRDPAFAVAFAEIPPPAHAPPDHPPSILEINGTHITVAGVSPDQAEGLVVGLARMLGVSIQVQQVERMIGAEPASALALPTLESYVPVDVPAAPPGRRQTKAQRLAVDQADVIAGILAYQDERREAAFVELAQRTPTPINRELCAKRIAERMVEGRTEAECRTAIDRMYERVGDANQAERSFRAAWWTAECWQPRAFGEVLALDVGGARPAGVSALVKQINAAAPPGAMQIAVLSKEQTRHVEHLKSVGHDDTAVLSTVICFAAVVAAQESQLAGRRALQPGEARLVKLWGPAMFKLPAWLGVQTAVEHFEANGSSIELFVQVSQALTGGQTQAAVKSG